jgi:hypothetical protein
MQRRKFIAGVGSLAAGAAAVTGTGAFTSVSAERSVSLSVVGDQNAYLGIETKSGSPYATQTNDGVELDFTGNGEGQGLNTDAFTKFNELITVRNNGSENVALWLNDGNSRSDSVESSLGGGANFVNNLANQLGATNKENSVSAVFFWSYARDDQPSAYSPFGTDGLGNNFSTGLDDDGVLRPDNIAAGPNGVFNRTQQHPPILTPGDSLSINIQINTKDDTGVDIQAGDLASAGGNIALCAFTQDFAQTLQS